MTLKKRILLLVIIIGCCCSSINAQTTKTDSCEGLQEMIDEAIYRLDALMGYNITLTKQMDSIKVEIPKKSAEFERILKKQIETTEALKDANKLLTKLGNRL